MATQLIPPTDRPGANAPGGPGRWARTIHVVLFILFLIGAAGWLLRLLGLPMAERWHWTEALIPVAAVATTLAALARRLPAENVLMAAALIGLIGGGVQTLGATTGIPFGAYIYTDKIGRRVFDILPWPMPLVWVVVILNARGVARLILRPWRKTSAYGFRLIGLTGVLAVVFDLALEPVASKVSRYWIWQTPETVPAWHTAPWTNFLGWFATALFILAFVTPCLINKKPGQRLPDYHPLVVWLVLNLIFATATATRQLWWATGFTLLATVLVTVFAVRGIRW